MFCENCGLQFWPNQSVCSRCGAAPTRCWFQLISLVTLAVALACNSLIALFLLPRLVDGHQTRLLFRSWLWLDEKGSLYGWVPVAMGLLAWDYLVRRRSRPKVKGWIARKLLTLVLAAGLAPFLPWWVPTNQPPQRFLATITRYPGLPSVVAWGVVTFVATLLCVSGESRQALLGNGKALSLVSLAALLVVLTMTLLGWSITCRWSILFIS